MSSLLNVLLKFTLVRKLPFNSGGSGGKIWSVTQEKKITAPLHALKKKSHTPLKLIIYITKFNCFFHENICFMTFI